MAEIRTIPIKTDPEKVISPGSNGRTKVYAFIPDVGKKDYSVPLWVSNKDAAKMEPGGTYLAKLSRGDKYWDWVSFGDPQEAAAEATEPPAAPQPSPDPSSGARPSPSPATSDTRVDGMRWGNSLNNAALLTVAYPEMSTEELFQLVAALAARFYFVTSEQIAALLPQGPSDEAQQWDGDVELPNEDQRPDTEA
jgi:hypothetical protein